MISIIGKEPTFDKDEIRVKMNKYTRRALGMLPKLNKPRILDLGCGSGEPTMEFARLTDANIVAIDIDKWALDKLRDKISKAGLNHRLTVIEGSIGSLDFADESFDILWSEGSIAALGFAQGLKYWRRFIKPGGYLGVHDELVDLELKIKLISKNGYKLLGHFLIPLETWREEFFKPLEERISEFAGLTINDPKTIEELNSAKRDLEMYRRTPERNQSVFFVMQKAEMNY